MQVNDLDVTIEPRPSNYFVETPFIKDVVNRALSYLRSGFAINLSGPAGVGKTTLALHIAGRLFRPVVLIYGNEEFGNSGMMGGMSGYRFKRVVDNYVQSVMKTEENFDRNWVDSRLVTACKMGYTLIYDEFTRSKPEANNVLLSVLEEGLLTLPQGNPAYIKVDSRFAAIFTSNPEEYAGVYKSQDALMDRMITLYLDQYDDETERAIAAARSGLGMKETRKVVEMIRRIRREEKIPMHPTVRASIAIAKLLYATGISVDPADERFRTLVKDVFSSHLNGIETRVKVLEMLDRYMIGLQGKEGKHERGQGERPR